ncbi:MAG TPA: DUF5719 family protein [Acidimicrobiales bacterium]
MTPARRGFVVLLMAAALVGAGVADRSGRESSASPSSRSSLLPSVLEAAAVMPSAASARALASAWSCPLATAAGAAGAAEGQVVVANVGDGPLSGVVTVTPADGEAANKTITVDPHSSLQVKESDVVHLGADRPWASALVDLHGGQAGVELLASGQWGTSITPCSPSASDHWYFATGSTAVDATMMMGLFNPFPSDAVVDLAFVTDQGPANPSEFQGVVVPARGLRVLDIGDHVRRRDALAATVTARTGRVVAERLQARTGGNAGLTAALGAPSPGETWYFPDGYSADHDIEHYVIYNPEPAEAHVSLKVNLDTGSAEPFDLTVPPAATFTVMVESESRIPPQVGHSAELHSLNGVPVVVERTVQASAPAPRVGGGAMVGARVAAPRWLLPVGNATAGVDEWVVVYNPGAMAATVSLRALEDGQEMAIPQMQGVAIPPGRRHAFRLGDQLQLSPLPVVVGATAPVVVERDLYVNGQPVLILNAGEPLP